MADLLALAGRVIATPEHLGAIPPAEVSALCQLSPEPRVTRALWGEQRAYFTHGGTAAHLIQPPGEISQDTLLKALKRRAKQFQKSRMATIHSAKKLRSPAEFARMGPAMKIKHLASGSALPMAVSRYVADIAQANLLKLVRGSLSPELHLRFADTSRSVSSRTPPPSPTYGGGRVAAEQCLQ